MTGAMRICHVVESGATGALEMVLLAAETQRKRGDRVLILHARRPGAPADLRARVHPDVRVEHLRMRPLVPHLPRWCLGLRRALKRWRPDVLHLHCSRAGFLGRLVAGPGFAGRVLYSPHCISLMHLDISPAGRALCRALERLAQRVRPALYLACAAPEQAVIGRELGAPVRLVENAVEDGLALRFRRTPSPRPQLRRVVSCARIAPLKDPHMFAEVCRAVRGTRPHVEFEWIGDGDPAARRALEAAGVRVAGWLPRDQALRRVAGASVYLSTSRWEGMPVSLIEAMALDVPVLCRRADWSEAVVRDGETGRLFGDARAAADILLAPDRHWQPQVAAAARTAAAERFSEARFGAALARACGDPRARG